MTFTPTPLTLLQARRIILSAQGLTKSNAFGSGPNAVAKVVNQLGYVQIDTISVVERAHHHIIWSRLHDYDPEWLEKAQYKRREIFEYWAHAAAYLPMQDYRFSLPVMNFFRDKKDNWPKSSKADVKKVLHRIREEGPLMSRDFESDHKGGTWWDWKPPKWALQRLFLEGHLMVSHREGFQRVYDLPERIIPANLNVTTPSLEEYYTYLITTTLRSQGLATRNEILHLRKTTPKKFDKVLHQLLEEQIIVPVQIEEKKSYFTLPDYIHQKIRLPEKIRLISPFDNIVIWRKRLKDIFDFDYTLECYLPPEKRTYGYFCLPVLYKDEFVGRVDVKADRKNSLLQIKKEHWNENQKDLRSDPLYEEAMTSFANFNNCNRIG